MSKIDYARFERIMKDLSSDEETAEVIKYKIDWNQSRTTLTIEIRLLHAEEAKKESIDIRFKSEHLFVNTKQARRPIIDGPTFHKIRPDNCNWWLEEGNLLFISLEKAIEGIEWDEVIVKSTVRSNKIDHEERRRKERQAANLEKRNEEDAERKRKGAPTVSEGLVESMGPLSYPPREKHRPYKDNKEDEWLFQVD